LPHEVRSEGLCVNYGKAVAVRNVNFVAPGGSVTGVVGPNGAGKSSLLLALYGAVSATGIVSLDGQNVSRDSSSARVRQGISIVPQGRQLFPRLSVTENLRVMAEFLKLPRSAVDEALDRFPILRSRARNLAGVLSGGEQQMLVISRALMTAPAVLLLDEMATGLAPRIVVSLTDTIKGLAAEGVAVVYAAPEIGAVTESIDRGYVMIRGELTESVENGGAALDKMYRAAMGVEISESLEN
jgi:branched-chain amino acid transport system ATP-binding protein